MKKIGLLSDTHSFLPKEIYAFFKDVDEIWHAGDIGNMKVWDDLEKFKPCRGVYGNIDGQACRRTLPLNNRFQIEGVSVFMTHIGGYPGRYSKRIVQELKLNKPDLFVCGHSHILKIIYDKKYQMLTINPGAAGKEGFQSVNTLVRFTIDGTSFRDMEILDMKR